MHRTCSESGGTEGLDICTDDCGGYWNATFGDGYKYRYYIMGEYHTNTGTCSLPISPVPSEKYYPFTPVRAWALGRAYPTAMMCLAVARFVSRVANQVESP